jgi:hypothetical protein
MQLKCVQGKDVDGGADSGYSIAVRLSYLCSHHTTNELVNNLLDMQVWHTVIFVTSDGEETLCP